MLHRNLALVILITICAELAWTVSDAHSLAAVHVLGRFFGN